MIWQEFLKETLGIGADDVKKPGPVMVSFVNRYLVGMGDIHYRIKYSGKTIDGVTTEESHSVRFQPIDFEIIFVFARTRSGAYKEIDRFKPEENKAVLRRERMKSIKVNAKTQPHPADTVPHKKAKSKTPAPKTSEPPNSNQGVIPVVGKNPNGEPEQKASRPVPNGITVDQLKKIFPQAPKTQLQELCDEVNVDLVKYRLDTKFRKAHFFAQVKGETGAAMRPVNESWEYSPETLKKFSSYYRKHPDEAKADGYLKELVTAKSGGKEMKRLKITRHANQQAIGEKHFLRLNGNRLDHTADGFNFRGRGFIQLTGFEKYNGFMTGYSKFWSGKAPDVVTNPDSINEAPNAIRSAIWFWNERKLYAMADNEGGSKDVTRISTTVNGGDMGLAERKEAYKLAEEAFK